jgi:cell division protein FtsB
MRPKRKIQHRFLRPLPIVAVVFAIALAAWFVLGQDGLWNSWKVRRNLRAQAAQIAELEAKKLELQKYLASLKAGDDLALERAAREHGLVASNETIYEVKVDSTR